ncbi:MAG: T9SS type A sorting domain-containing protein [Saprospiraceae bacterium]|nr:T9SS type A sorting domain-containing protein [Saprospiraceae bacterium]
MKKLIGDKILKLSISALMVLLFSGLNTALKAQVKTTILKQENIRTVISDFTDEEPRAYRLPSVDVQGVLAEDRKKGSTLDRFGVKVTTDWSIRNGVFFKTPEGQQVWKSRFISTGATSLNFLLEDLVLPEGSELFIYDKTKTMIIGPVTAAQFIDRSWSSDIILGDEATIAVYLNAAQVKEFSIRVAAVTHGFKNTSGLDLRAFGDSQSCNNDVACSIGNSWSDEKDAVALVLVNNSAHCSGTLLNGAGSCNGLRPFFLTANHCYLQATNVGNWVFRFRYESPSCGGSEPTSWISYSGSTLRARHADTDFALVELNQSVVGRSEIAFAGWNRQSSPPDNNIGAIHHPAGDVKKISLDNEDLDTQGDFWLIDQWDDGLVEPGSSGCALFDQNKRVIGQLQGGDENIGCSSGGSLVDNNTFGKFNLSWTGGGTNASRLSNWLGSGSATTSNTVRSPYLTGPDVLCSSNQTFTLNNPIPGLSVSWQVSPTNLFSGSTSGSGSSASVRGNSSYSGQGTITFTIDPGSGCTDIILTKSFWVGKVSSSYTSISGDQYVCPYDFAGYHANVSNTLARNSVTAYNWTWPSGWNLYYQADNDLVLQAPFSFGPSVIEFTVSNSCGTSLPPEVMQVYQEYFGCGFYISTYPNPAQEELTVEWQELEGASKNGSSTQIRLIDQTGRVLQRRITQGIKETLDISSLGHGLYILELERDGQLHRKKVIISQR